MQSTSFVHPPLMTYSDLVTGIINISGPFPSEGLKSWRVSPTIVEVLAILSPSCQGVDLAHFKGLLSTVVTSSTRFPAKRCLEYFP